MKKETADILDQPQKLILGLIVFIFLFVGCFLWLMPIHSIKDVRRSEICREMINAEECFVPTLLGEPILTKPPLFYWLGSSLYRISGFKIISIIRYVHFFSAVLLLCFLFYFTKKNKGKQSAVYAVGILATMQVFFVHTYSADIDVLFLLFNTIAFFSFYDFFFKESGKFNFYIGIIFCGLAILTKGPVTGLYVIFPFLIYFLVKRKWEWLVRIPWISGVVLFLIVLSPWIVFTFFNKYDAGSVMLEQNLGALINFNIFSALRYFLDLFFSTFPWFVFLIIVLLKNFRKSEELFMFFAIFAPIFILGLSSKYEIRYLLPIFPLIAFVIGSFFSELLSLCFGNRSFKLITKLIVAFNLFLIFLMLLILGITSLYLLFVPCLIIIVLLSLFLFKKVKLNFIEINISSLLLIFFMYFLADVYVARKDFNYNFYKKITGEEYILNEDNVFILDDNKNGKESWMFSLYANRVIPFMHSEQVVEAVKEAEEDVFFVLRKKYLKNFNEIPENRTEVKYTISSKDHYKKFFPMLLQGLFPEEEYFLIKCSEQNEG